MTDHKCGIILYFIYFRHGISVLANFSYCIVVLGTPPPNVPLLMFSLQACVKMADSRKCPYHTTDSFLILTPPPPPLALDLWKFQNGLFPHALRIP